MTAFGSRIGGEFGPFAAPVVGLVVGAIIVNILVEGSKERVEIARRRIERQHQRADLGAQEMIGAGRSERRQSFELAGIDEFQYRRHIREVADLALAARNALANGGQEPRCDVATLGPRQGVEALASEGLLYACSR